jgi:hypothetical protein
MARILPPGTFASAHARMRARVHLTQLPGIGRRHMIRRAIVARPIGQMSTAYTPKATKERSGLFTSKQMDAAIKILVARERAKLDRENR